MLRKTKQTRSIKIFSLRSWFRFLNAPISGILSPSVSQTRCASFLLKLQRNKQSKVFIDGYHFIIIFFFFCHTHSLLRKFVVHCIYEICFFLIKCVKGWLCSYVCELSHNSPLLSIKMGLKV